MTTRLAVITLLAACGSAHHTPDANRDTSSGDALMQATADAPPGAVTITITNAGVPVAGAAVYFQNSDSSLVLASGTDKNGTVGTVLAAGGFVTAFEPPDSSGLTKIDTFAGVKPGDALRLDLAPLGPPGGETSSMLVHPATAATATAIRVSSPCGYGMVGLGGSGDIGWQGCPPLTDLLVTEVDAQSAPLGSYFKADVTIGPAPSDAAGYPVDLSATPYDESLSHATYDYAAVIDTINVVATTQELWSAKGRLFDDTTATQRTNSTVHSAIDQPVPAGSALFAVTVSDFVPVPNGSLHGENLVYEWGSYATAYSLDYSQALLPYLSDAMYDASAHAITWTEGAAGQMPQFARATITAYRDAIPSGTTWQWNLIAPRTATPSLAFPVIPINGFDYNPSASDQVSVSNLTNGKLTPGSYDDVRAHGFASIAAVADPSGGHSGRLAIQLPYTSPL